MSMTRFRAGQLWSNPLDIRIGRTTYRTATATGWVGAEFILKLFSPRGRAMTFPGRVSRSSTTLVGSVDSPFVIGSGGLQAQVYWKFQYDLNIGGLGRFAV